MDGVGCSVGCRAWGLMRASAVLSVEGVWSTVARKAVRADDDESHAREWCGMWGVGRSVGCRV